MVGGAAACVLVMLVVAGLTISSTGGEDDGAAGPTPPVRMLSAPTTEVGASTVVAASKVDPLVDAVEPSTVALRVERAGGSGRATGLVAMSSGMIVTASSAVEGARSITVTESGGTSYPGTLVASDPGSGLAVVHIAGDLPAFSYDQTNPDVGGWAVAMSLVASGHRGARPVAEVYAGSVTAIPTVGSQELSTIDARLPLGSVDIGCPLIDPDQKVAGLLESVRTVDGTRTSVFLPAKLVSRVALQLVESGQVDQGWLGVAVRSAGTSATGTTGALIEGVSPGGPAASWGLTAGDVITAVDDAPIRSSADLWTDMYAMAPDTQVDLTYTSGTSGPRHAYVTLASAVAGAPVLSASP